MSRAPATTAPATSVAGVTDEQNPKEHLILLIAVCGRIKYDASG